MADERETAADLLAMCASGRGETLRELAAAIGLTDVRTVLLARRTYLAAIRGSRGLGLSWREVRAEAEARLRCST